MVGGVEFFWGVCLYFSGVVGLLYMSNRQNLRTCTDVSGRHGYKENGENHAKPIGADPTPIPYI